MPWDFNIGAEIQGLFDDCGYEAAQLLRKRPSDGIRLHTRSNFTKKEHIKYEGPKARACRLEAQKRYNRRYYAKLGRTIHDKKSKLTLDQVKEIRAAWSPFCADRALSIARGYGIGYAYAMQIISGYRYEDARWQEHYKGTMNSTRRERARHHYHKWRAKSQAASPLVRYGEKNGRCKLTRVDVTEIRRLYSTMTTRAIACLYSVSQSTVYDIVTFKTWRMADAV